MASDEKGATSANTPSKATTPEPERHRMDRLRLEGAGVIGHPQHEIEGAIVFHDWKPGTVLSLDEFKAGIEEFLKAPAADKVEA